MERQVRRAKKKKGSKRQRAKPPTPTQLIDALIGDEKQNGKQANRKRKEQGVGPQPSYPSRLLRPVWIILFPSLRDLYK